MKSTLLLVVPPAVLSTLMAAACSNSLPAKGERDRAAQEQTMAEAAPTVQNVAPQQSAAAGSPDETCGEPVASLPFARGRTFSRLDEYLAYLEQQGAIDLPWWRQVGPGVYERVVRMPEAPRETATREQLMVRFGFRC